jgi:hypothetical protein
MGDGRWGILAEVSTHASLLSLDPIFLGFRVLIGVLRKTRAWPIGTRIASEWRASLSLALRATVRNTPIKAWFPHDPGRGVNLPFIGTVAYMLSARPMPNVRMLPIRQAV